MNKQKLQQQVNELKAKLAEVEAELTKPEDTINYWKPKEGDKLFYVDAWGNCTYSIAKDNTTDRYRVFKTEQQAQAYAEYVKAEEALKAEIARLNEGWWPDWKDDQMPKHFIYIVNEKLGLDLKWSVKTLPNFMYLKSKELAEQLTTTHSKELITYLSY